MKIENVKTVKLYIEGKSFEFSYEQLTSVECSFESEDTVLITVKPTDYDSRLEEN